MTAVQGGEMLTSKATREAYGAAEVPHEITAEAVEFRRSTNGRWTAEVRVELSVHLPDGRELRETRTVPIGGILQEGRRTTRRS